MSKLQLKKNMIDFLNDIDEDKFTKSLNSKIITLFVEFKKDMIDFLNDIDEDKFTKPLTNKIMKFFNKKEEIKQNKDDKRCHAAILNKITKKPDVQCSRKSFENNLCKQHCKNLSHGLFNITSQEEEEEEDEEENKVKLQDKSDSDKESHGYDKADYESESDNEKIEYHELTESEIDLVIDTNIEVFISENNFENEKENIKQIKDNILGNNSNLKNKLYLNKKLKEIYKKKALIIKNEVERKFDNIVKKTKQTKNNSINKPKIEVDDEEEFKDVISEEEVKDINNNSSKKVIDEKVNDEEVSDEKVNDEEVSEIINEEVKEVVEKVITEIVNKNMNKAEEEEEEEESDSDEIKSSSEEEEEIKVREYIHKKTGKTYHLDIENSNLYDINTNELVGRLKNGKIQLKKIN